MARNPERRTALLDAAIEMLAAEGARGLTFRAVDARAGVPTGTASNYFADRDTLFGQIAGRVHERMTPDAAEFGDLLAMKPSRDQVKGFMHDLVRRMTAERSGYLAVLELRLEATRRPALREALSRTLGADFHSNIRFHVESGLPGDAQDVQVLFLAMTGLLLEYFTLPDIMTGSPEELDALVERVVERTIPEK
ncbi:TetR/AcrR family transcriptional regulator [Streptomyces sp. NPDC004111]|uniref:TetR/AcrR family transcriptional regulator n=1 Tax=Streptomyces sp. NPDC004111 TaxID=3364690 RepID=UPI0036A1B786